MIQILLQVEAVLHNIFVAGSIMRMKWNTQGDDFLYQLDGIINEVHKFWAERTCLEVEYKEILSMPVQLIENISASLRLPQTEQECEAIVNKIDKISSVDVLDNLTQFHPNNRSTEYFFYNDFLGEPLMAAISVRFSEWLKIYEYSS